jgi:hypothetical protein
VIAAVAFAHVSLVGVTVVANEPEAELVCGMLRADGIECTYRQTNFGAGTADGFSFGGPREILVDESDVDRARSLLVEAEDG